MHGRSGAGTRELFPKPDDLNHTCQANPQHGQQTLIWQAVAGEDQQHARSGAALPHEYTIPVSARMGFAPIPLLCLMVRVIGHDVWPMLNVRHPSGWLLCFLVWLSFCALKVLTTVTLLGFACKRTKHSERSTAERSSHEGGQLNLKGVDRFTLYGKCIF